MSFHEIDAFLKESLKDSPQFRAAVNRCTKEILEFQKWLESFLKAVKGLKESHQYNATTHGQLADLIGSLKPSGLIDASTAITLNSIIRNDRAIYHLFVERLNSDVISSVGAYLKTNIYSMKETLKLHDRLQEKLDNYAAKYASLKANYAVSGVEEESVLLTLQKEYAEMSLDVALQCYVYNTECKEFLSRTISKFLLYWSEFHHELALNIHGPFTYSKTWHVKNAEKIGVLEKRKLELKSEINVLKDVVKSWTLGEKNFPIDSFDIDSGRKCGYLLKKYDQSIGPASWNRRFFFLENGRIFYSFLADTERSPKLILQNRPANVLLCNTKILNREERRFVFEIVNPTRHSWILQGESEADVNSWIKAINNAKLQISESDDPLAISPYNDIYEESVEYSDDGEYIYPVPISFMNDEINNSSAISHSDIGSEHRNLEFYEKRLIELLPNDEYVGSKLFEAIACFLLRDKNQIAGLLYIREADMIFHANIFGVDIKIIRLFKEITSVTSSRNSYFSTILMEIGDKEKMDFKIALEREEKTMYIITRIWLNSTGETPISVLDLVKEISGGRSLSSNDSAGDFKLNEKKTAYKLPAEIMQPIESIKCGCDSHLEVISVDSDVNLPAFVLFTLMFGQDSHKFWERVDSLTEITGRKEGQWSNDAVPQREFEYDVPVNNPLYKFKTARVFGTTKIIKKQEHIVYVVEEIAKTPAVPYGDTFQTITRYCINWNSQEKCHLLISGEIEWLKNPLVKGLIKGAAMKGLCDTAKSAIEVVERGLSNLPIPIKRPKSKKKNEVAKPKFIPIQYKHFTALILLIVGLLLLNCYNWYQIQTLVPTDVTGGCITQFSLENWKPKVSDKSLVTNFITNHFSNGTLNLNVEYKTQDQAKKFKQYSEFVTNSKLLMTELLQDVKILNQIQESTMEALYQNWHLDILLNRDRKDNT